MLNEEITAAIKKSLPEEIADVMPIGIADTSLIVEYATIGINTE